MDVTSDVTSDVIGDAVSFNAATRSPESGVAGCERVQWIRACAMDLHRCEAEEYHRRMITMRSEQ